MNNSTSNDFDEMLKAFRESFTAVKAERESIQISNGRKRLFAELFCALDDMRWQPEYNAIGDWLTDSNGKCLLLYGDSGRGKTFIATKVIPHIYKHWTFENGDPRQFRIVKARDIGKQIEELKSVKLLVVDEVGAEDAIYNNYGNKTNPMLDLLDASEERGSLLILTTNLNADDMKQYFGVRGWDRLRSLFKSVMFRGESLRIN